MSPSRGPLDDEGPIEHLLERYLPVARAFVRRRMGNLLRSREDSLDLVQSVCRRALEQRHNYRHENEAKFQAWLLEIVENKIIDRYRELKAIRRDPDREVPIDTQQAELTESRSSPSPVTLAERKERRAFLNRALDLLSPIHAQAILLHELESLSYEKLAERLGLTHKQGRLRVLEAKLELARALRSLEEE